VNKFMSMVDRYMSTAYFAALVLAIQLFFAMDASAGTIERRATLVECYDGDTCTFDINLGLDTIARRRVRFCDIDTPEVRGPSRKYGLFAKGWTTSKIRESKSIRLLFPVRDNELRSEYWTFNRVLAWVFLDGIDIGRTAVSAGVAVESNRRCKR